MRKSGQRWANVMVRKVKEQKLRKAVMSLTLTAESEDLNINVCNLGFTFHYFSCMCKNKVGFASEFASHKSSS